jgi:hypothetical protein
MDELLMKLTFRSVEIVNSFSVEKQSDICSDTKSWIKVICCMGGNVNSIMILLKLNRFYGSQLMIGYHHLRTSFPFSWTIIIFNVTVFEYVLIVYENIETLVHDFPVLFTVNMVSHIISVQRISLSVLHYTATSFGKGVLKLL